VSLFEEEEIPECAGLEKGHVKIQWKAAVSCPEMTQERPHL
jgi:hypothetical protein